MNTKDVLVGILILLFSLIVQLSFSLLIELFSKLQNTLNQTNSENIKLLDGMHEGVLIISSESKKIMFCNKPAE